MIHEELKQLESIYLLLNDAFYNEDENKMKILFNEFINNFPQYIKSKNDNISDVFIEHGKIPGRPCSIFLNIPQYYIVMYLHLLRKWNKAYLVFYRVL